MQVDAFADFRRRKLVFHGLRKFAVNALLEAGFTDAEVASITGQSREMIEHYSRQVNQRKLAKARWRSGKANSRRTTFVKPKAHRL